MCPASKTSTQHWIFETFNTPTWNLQKLQHNVGLLKHSTPTWEQGAHWENLVIHHRGRCQRGRRSHGEVAELHGCLNKTISTSGTTEKKVPQWDGLKVVTIEIIEIVTTIIVTTFKRCNNLNML